MKQSLLVLTLLWATLFTPAKAQQSDWDAALFGDLCNLVLRGGEGIENTLRTYQLVNNFTHADGYGFTSLYSRYAKVDYNGNLKSLTNGGVSNVVMAVQRTDHTGACHISSSFFSATNATKFRQQITQLGFQKVKTQGARTYYVHPEVPQLEVAEEKTRMGKYQMWIFTIQLPS